MSTATTTGFRRNSREYRAAMHAFAWTAVFVVWHGYWALGGDFGFGDQQSGFPDTTSSLAGWVFSTAVAGMFVAGLAVPLALMRGAGPRRLLVGLMWAGAAVLAARGIVGLVDDVLRFTGLQETGLSGLSNQEVLGTARPPAYTIWSTIGIDAFFAAGGLLFARAARQTRPHGHRKRLVLRRGLELVANATVSWAALFALVHLYWAAGGAIGMNGEPADTPAAQAYIAFIAVLGIAGAAVAHGRGHDWGTRQRRRWPTVLARAGGVVLLVGVAVSAGRWLAQGSLGGDGAAGIAITAYFLLGGILFSTLGWRAVSADRRTPSRGSGRRAADRIRGLGS